MFLFCSISLYIMELKYNSYVIVLLENTVKCNLNVINFISTFLLEPILRQLTGIKIKSVHLMKPHSLSHCSFAALHEQQFSLFGHLVAMRWLRYLSFWRYVFRAARIHSNCEYFMQH